MADEDETKRRMQDLFGSDDDDDDDDDEDVDEQMEGNDAQPANYGQQEDRLEEDDGKDDDPDRTETIQMPHLLPIPPNSQKCFMKMINVLGLETRPFDPDTYKDEHKVQFVDNDGKERMKLTDENVIRWRYVNDDDGNIARESNGRFVRWSDGSLQLHLGHKVFDVVEQDVATQNFHLYTRHHRLMRCQGRLKRKLILKPTQHSKSLTVAIADDQNRERKIKLVEAGIDPEKEKRMNEEKERKSIAQSERARRRQASKALDSGYSDKRFTSQFLEHDYSDDEEDDTSFSLQAIKRRKRNIDDEDSDLRVATAKSRSRVDSDDDEKEGGDDGAALLDDDEDEAEVTDEGDNDDDDDDDDDDDTERGDPGEAPVGGKDSRGDADSDGADDDEESILPTRRKVTSRKVRVLSDDDDDD